MIECTCKNLKYAAAWHDEPCPWADVTNHCEQCNGEGRIATPAGCGCCTDVNTCEECSGTGMRPVTVSAPPGVGPGG